MNLYFCKLLVGSQFVTADNIERSFFEVTQLTFHVPPLGNDFPFKVSLVMAAAGTAHVATRAVAAVAVAGTVAVAAATGAAAAAVVSSKKGMAEVGWPLPMEDCWQWQGQWQQQQQQVGWPLPMEDCWQWQGQHQQQQ